MPGTILPMVMTLSGFKVQDDGVVQGFIHNSQSEGHLDVHIFVFLVALAMESKNMDAGLLSTDDCPLTNICVCVC